MNPLSAIYSKVSNFPFIFALVLVWIYFWVNGPAHFPNWSESYSPLMLTYLGMTVLFLFFAKRQTETQIQSPISRSMISFSMFFIITLLFLSTVSLLGLYSHPEFDQSLFWPTFIIQIFVVATAEELMFRGVLLPYIGVILQAVLFAAWHAYAYQIIYYNLTWETLNWPAALMAFVMGVLLGIIAKDKRFGLPATIAIHGVFNAWSLGALAL